MFGPGNRPIESAPLSAAPTTVDLPAQNPADGDDATTVSWWVKTIASWVLLTGAVGLLGALVVVPRVTGSTAYTVLTGSMKPDYPPGTLIVVRPTPGDDLAAGDVITFQPESGNPAVITHRIVSIFYDNQGHRRFITKGDANKVQDDTQLVDEQIRGRLLYSVPYVGHVNSLLSGSTRTIAMNAIVGGLGVYAVWMWAGGLRDRRRATAAESLDNLVRDDHDDVTPPTTAFARPSVPRWTESGPATSPAPTCPTCGSTVSRPVPQANSRRSVRPTTGLGSASEITAPIPLPNY